MTLNRYLYVNGDPLNLIDPTGHMTCLEGDSNPSCDYYKPRYNDQNQPGGGSASTSPISDPFRMVVNTVLGLASSSAATHAGTTNGQGGKGEGGGDGGGGDEPPAPTGIVRVLAVRVCIEGVWVDVIDLVDVRTGEVVGTEYVNTFEPCIQLKWSSNLPDSSTRLRSEQMQVNMLSNLTTTQHIQMAVGNVELLTVLRALPDTSQMRGLVGGCYGVCSAIGNSKCPQSLDQSLSEEGAYGRLGVAGG